MTDQRRQPNPTEPSIQQQLGNENDRAEEKGQTRSMEPVNTFSKREGPRQPDDSEAKNDENGGREELSRARAESAHPVLADDLRGHEPEREKLSQEAEAVEPDIHPVIESNRRAEGIVSLWDQRLLRNGNPADMAKINPYPIRLTKSAMYITMLLSDASMGPIVRRRS